ncbi:MAG: 50S ribosomal protein L10 [Coriobacteriales bacterium]|jgi:large subunit ribosomal protein L10
MPTQEKVQQVAEITEQFQNTAGCWFIDARGLTVKEVQELRVNIRKGGGAMHVYKNTLARRALNDLDLPELPEILSGPTAFVFCDDDIAAPAKAIKDFMDEHEALELKGGLVDGAEVSVEDALKIAELPSKDQLIAMLLSTMQAPLTGLVRVCNAPMESLARGLKAVADKQAA